MAAKTATVEKWVWILIYGGLLTGVAGLALRNDLPGLAWTLVGGGGVVAAVGVVLIWVRSRMTDDSAPPKGKP